MWAEHDKNAVLFPQHSDDSTPVEIRPHKTLRNDNWAGSSLSNAEEDSGHTQTTVTVQFSCSKQQIEQIDALRHKSVRACVIESEREQDKKKDTPQAKYCVRSF